MGEFRSDAINKCYVEYMYDMRYVRLTQLVKSLAASTRVHLCDVQEVRAQESIPGADNLDLGFHPCGVGELSVYSG